MYINIKILLICALQRILLFIIQSQGSENLIFIHNIHAEIFMNA
jgi:hypothetical protein